MTRFVVDLGNARISEQKKNAIAAGIQSLVIGHLADGEAPAGRFIGVIPPSWRGYILLEEFGAIEVAGQEAATFANRGQSGK